MLPEHHRQLLTAYVDGELTQRQRKAVQRLLRRAPEARRLLQQLERDAQSVRNLPRAQLGPDFPAKVLLTIRDRGLQPVRHRRSASTLQPLPAWPGLALAASVLLLVGFGSYLYFIALPPDDTTGSALAQQSPGKSPDTKKVTPAPPVPAAPPIEIKEPTRPPQENVPSAPSSGAVAEKGPTKPDPGKTPADASSESALTLPIPKMELFQPREASAALPSIGKFSTLDPGKLREELQKDSGFRLELPVRESARALERLQAVLTANGIGLLIDQGAQVRLNRKMQTNYVLYVEDLLPEELTRALQQVGDEDRKAEAKHRGDGLFDNFVVTHMGPDDRKELSELLSIDPKQVQSTKPGTPLNVDIHKPLSETTAEQVAQSLAGQGNTPRPEPGKPTVKPPEHLALVLAYNPVRPRPGSVEIKRFLDSRKPPRSGAIQVLLVLRDTKG